MAGFHLNGRFKIPLRGLRKRCSAALVVPSSTGSWLFGNAEFNGAGANFASRSALIRDVIFCFRASIEVCSLVSP